MVDPKEYWNRYNHSPKRKVVSHRYTRKLRLTILAAYGNKCVCCGEAREEFLTIDHINGDGADERRRITIPLYAWIKKQNFPKDKYRLLCWNCNCSIGRYGYCPHQRKI